MKIACWVVATWLSLLLGPMPLLPSAAFAQDDAARAVLADVLAQTPTPAAAVIAAGPDGAVAVVVGGVRKAGGGDPVTADDAWHIGSNAKAMTATLALSLVEDGIIGLDDTVKDTLGERARIDEGWGDVSLRDLLQHRGGVAPNAGRTTLVRYMLFGGSGEADAAKDRAKVVAKTLKKPPPGERGVFAYSNLGYTVAGQMLAEAAGEPFEALLRSRVTDPLGAASLRLGPPEAFRGHVGHPPKARPAGADNPYFMAPAGTFSLSARDYAAFLTDQLRGQMGLDGTLLAASSYEAMSGVPEGGTYGLGWGVREDGTLSHSGSNTMWYASAVVMPRRGIAVAVLTNHGGAGDLSGYLDALAEAYGAHDAERAPPR